MGPAAARLHVIRRIAPLLAALLAIPAAAADLALTVTDPSGKPIGDAVVYALPTSGQAVNRVAREGIIDQIDREFVPRVTAIQVGAAVRFPNKDNIRHQVYSFSPPKTFTLKLYSGTPSAPVVFEKTGEVALGCNIHDAMLAFVYVVDTPYFAKTNARGEAHLSIDVHGDYDVKVWHPDQKTEPVAQAWREGGPANAPLRFTLELQSLQGALADGQRR